MLTTLLDILYYLNRANIYSKHLFHEHALKDLGRAIQLDPNYAAAYVDRAFILAWTEQYDRTWSDAKKACELGDCSALRFFETPDITGSRRTIPGSPER